MVKKLEANLCQSFRADLKAHPQQQQQNLDPAGCLSALCSLGESVFNEWNAYLFLSFRARSRITSLGSHSCLLAGLPQVSTPTVVSPRVSGSLARAGRFLLSELLAEPRTGPARSRQSAHTCGKSGHRYENNESIIFITEPTYWSTHDTSGDLTPL